MNFKKLSVNGKIIEKSEQSILDDSKSGQNLLSTTMKRMEDRSITTSSLIDHDQIKIYIQQLNRMAKQGFIIYRNQMDNKKLDPSKKNKISLKENFQPTLNQNQLMKNVLIMEKITGLDKQTTSVQRTSKVWSLPDNDNVDEVIDNLKS